MGLYYWEQAKIWSQRASRWPWIDLEEIHDWQDESYRIQTGELDYDRIIRKHLQRVDRVRTAFENMDESTY
jgi:hypothetical protein